jgi:hypothetical protein
LPDLYQVAFIDSIRPHPQPLLPPLPALSYKEREAEEVYSGEGTKATTIFERNLVLG